jgi:hypothetical protein
MLPHPGPRPGFTPARAGFPQRASDLVWPAHELRTLGQHQLVCRPGNAIAFYRKTLEEILTFWGRLRAIKVLITVLYPRLCAEAGESLPADWKPPALFSPTQAAQEHIRLPAAGAAGAGSC